MSGVRNAIGALVLVLLSVGGSLALGELAVRWIDARRAAQHPASLETLAAMAREAGVAPGGFNAYYLGGSTMAGVPYDPRMSIPKLVEAFFGGAVGGRTVHSVNLAQSGQDLRFNLDRLEVVLAHPEIFHPTLVVVLSGHNEFLKFQQPSLLEPDSASAWRRALAGSRLLQRLDARLATSYPLDMDERALFDRPCTRPATRERVYRLYEERLARVVDASVAAGAAVVLSTVPGNVSEFEPSRSVYCGPSERRGDFEALLARADDGTSDEALAALREAGAVCGSFAELHFRLGRALEARGDRDGARTAYQAALDADQMPLRATSGMNDTVRRVAASRDVALVDAVALLAERSSRPGPGYDWFADAHHPTAAGFVQISRAVAEAVRTRFRVAAPLAPIDAAEAERRFDLADPAFRFEKLVAKGRWFARIATMRFDPADRLARAEAAFREADALDARSPDPALGLAMVALLRRDAAAGDRLLAEARARDAVATERYLATPWVQAVVARARSEYPAALAKTGKDAAP